MKVKILWAVLILEICVAVPLTAVTWLARTGGATPAAVVASPTSARWVQTSETDYHGNLEETWFYTCASNGRKEGTVSARMGGLWDASSEHEVPYPDYAKVDAKYRTKEQAQVAIEQFVSKWNACGRPW